MVENKVIMKRVGIIAGSILVALVLIVCLVPLRDEAYTVTVNYTAPITKYLSLNYEAHDYTRIDIVEEYRQTGSCRCNRKLVKVEVQVACVDVENTDNIPSDFMVILSGFINGCVPFSQNYTLSLNVSERKTVEYQAEVIDEWYFEVLPGWKEVETGDFITERRQEIRYKKVTAIEYLLYYK